MNRFAVINISGLCLSIMNGYFDSENPDKVTTMGKWYKEYYYFSMKDSDDNTIEITGAYDERGDERE